MVAKVPLKKGTPTTDSFANLAARIGNSLDSSGNPLNQLSGGSYQLNPISRLRILLDYAYRSSWVVRAAVDIIPEDMTREGVDFDSSLPPNVLEELTESLNNLGIWGEIQNGLKWGRLYGGCVCFMMIDGQDPTTPLNLDTIGKGQFLGLFTADRWMVTPTLQDLVTEPGPYMGLPRFYDVVTDGNGTPKMRMHYTRCLRFQGDSLPYYQRQAENMWALSILESLYDRLMAYDSTTMGAAQLVFKAHLRTYKLENFRELVAEGGDMLEQVMQQIAMIRMFQSIEGMTVVDAKDELEVNTYQFSGLPDMMVQFGVQISGACRIPMVRLFGQSAPGMNSTGEADLKNYYDGVHSQREKVLRSPLTTLFTVMLRSLTGRSPPKGFHWHFPPLWQLSNEEKSEIDAKDVTAVTSLFTAGLISAQVALTELRTRGRITDRWQSLTDEVIKAADDEIPVPDMSMGGETGEEGGLNNPGKGDGSGDGNRTTGDKPDKPDKPDKDGSKPDA
jgi:phage-related protein (TIGR01555 family)